MSAQGTAGLTVAPALRSFIDAEVLPGLGIAPEGFWQGFATLLADFVPRNRALLAKREEIQAKLDAWHKAQGGTPIDARSYESFLKEIGYLVPVGADFAIDTADVDPELASIAGPQLVVPINN